MKVLIVNTSERIGGAAVAASRLREALKLNGVEVKMLVRDKQSHRIDVIALHRSWLLVVKFVWERVVIWAANRFRKNNLFAVDIANVGTDITSYADFKDADVIHLHWINQGFLSLENIRKILNSGKPVVWTMHDMWPCTGICHHARQCEAYHGGCHQCMYLYGGGGTKDLSYRIFRKKQALYKDAPLAFVTCSRWLEGQARKSALLQGKEIMAIPNPINTNLFNSTDKTEARTKLGLPQDRPLILFGSVKITDKRKGIDYLVEACKLLAAGYPEFREKLGVVVFGTNSEQLRELLPFEVFPLDYVSDEKAIVSIYNTVDMYVTPSLEENLPNTIMEAMACGVPCVGYQVGGIPEMIDHHRNGYVAEYESAEDFAKGIYWVLTHPEYAALCQECVEKVKALYSEESVARRYMELYHTLLEKKNG